MTTGNSEVSQNWWARLAGFLYLFTYAVPITGWTISGHYEVAGNFAETAHRITGAELWYRFGLSLVLFNGFLCIFLAMGLYATLKPVNSTLALFGLIFRLGENMLAMGFGVLSFAAIKAYSTLDAGTFFTPKQLATGMALLAEANAVEFNVSMALLGIGSAFFFYVFLKSGYIPRVLSLYSLWTCPIFVAACLAYLYWPRYAPKLQLGWLPLALAEIMVGLWLLIKGVKLPAAASVGQA